MSKQVFELMAKLLENGLVHRATIDLTMNAAEFCLIFDDATKTTHLYQNDNGPAEACDVFKTRIGVTEFHISEWRAATAEETARVAAEGHAPRRERSMTVTP